MVRVTSERIYREGGSTLATLGVITKVEVTAVFHSSVIMTSQRAL